MYSYLLVCTSCISLLMYFLISCCPYCAFTVQFHDRVLRERHCQPVLVFSFCIEHEDALLVQSVQLFLKL